jgi:hypothetical protein
MDDWLDRFADALAVARLGPAEVDAVLDLARVVAHGTERRNAPLATFLAGRASAGREGGGEAAAALAVAQGLLGDGGPSRPGS